MEEGEGTVDKSPSLVDISVLDYAEAGKSSAADKCYGGSLSDDGIGWADCDEEADEAFYLNREGKKRHEEFYNAGYREGLSAGKNDAAQDGFNHGFKDSVMIGYKWGRIRGVTSALAHIPNELKLKLIETEEIRKEFQNMYEDVDSITTEDALKLFYDDIQRGKAVERIETIESDPSISHPSGSEHSNLESYFEKLDLLLKESPRLTVTELSESK